MTTTPFKSRLKDLAALVLQHLIDSGLATHSSYNNRIRWTASAERFRLVAADQSPEEYADNLAGQLFDVFGAGVAVNGGAPEFGQVLNRLAEVSADTNGIKAALQCLVNKVTGKPEAPPAVSARSGMTIGLMHDTANDVYSIWTGAGTLPERFDLFSSGVAALAKYLADEYPEQSSRHLKKEAPPAPDGRRLLAGIFERPFTDYPYMIDGSLSGDVYTNDVRKALQMLVDDVSGALAAAGGRPVYLTDDDPAGARHTPKTDMTVEAFNAIHGVPVLSLNFEKYSGMYHLWNGDKLVATDASLPEALQNLVNYIWLNWHIAKKD